MGALFGSVIFGIAIVALGVVFFKRNKKLAIVEFVCGSIFIIAGTIALFFSTQTQAKKPNLNMRISYAAELENKIDTNILNTILNNFVQKCEGIKKHSDCVESVEVKVRKYENEFDMSYMQEINGWLTEIEVIIKIKSAPSLTIQNRLISGQTLYFYLGGGLKPGIETMKDESALFFGIDKSQMKSGENLYIPVASYEAIDNLVKEN